MDYEGYVDFAGCTLVAGWARSLVRPEVPLAVDILLDGRVLATAMADQFQQALLEAGKADGRCAFSVMIAPRWRDGKVHVVEARVSGTQTALAPGQRQIEFPYDISEPIPRVIMNNVARVSVGQLGGAPATSVLRDRLTPPPMKIHIVCYEDVDDWILGKIARKLHHSLKAIGMDVTLGKEADAAADINHHIIYWGYVDRKRTVETVMVTHIDNYRELGKVRQQLVDVDVEMGICMSFEAVNRLAHFGVPRQRLCFVNPAHDHAVRPRKVLIGITSRVYPDGCKREHLVQELAGLIAPEHFKFAIMGAGWERVVEALEQKGIEVEYVDHFDYDAYCELIPRLDYYLYTGLDEGSMGFMDAVAAAVPTIVVPQGYHLDAPGGITHPFHDLDDLVRIFAEIAGQRIRRASSVADWTWEENARKHALVWHYLLCRKRGVSVPKAMNDQLAQLGVVSALDGQF
jgi:hypothetical protein